MISSYFVGVCLDIKISSCSQRDALFSTANYLHSEPRWQCLIVYSAGTRYKGGEQPRDGHTPEKHVTFTLGGHGPMCGAEEDLEW